MSNKITFKNWLANLWQCISQASCLIGRTFTVVAIIIATGSAFAQKYNENWLDSVPYLMEHVRNHEPWAYENLARCYRYGIELEKSIVNAMIYYDKAEVNERELAENAYASDPSDELGFMNHLMEGLDKKRITVEEAEALLSSYPEPLPKWGCCMKQIFHNRNNEDLEGFVESSIDLSTITADELAASIALLRFLRPDTPSITSRPSTPEFLSKLSLVAEIIPALYDIAGNKYWAQYEDCPRDKQAMKKAFELFHKAYLYGLLEARGAVAVLDYRDNNQLYEGFPFSQEELTHLDGFYSKEYRSHFKSSCIVEECAVEDLNDDESPVVLESEAY